MSINIKNIGEVRGSPLFWGFVTGISGTTLTVSVIYPKNYGNKIVSCSPEVEYTPSAVNPSINGSYAFCIGDQVIVKMKENSGRVEPDIIIAPAYGKRTPYAYGMLSPDNAYKYYTNEGATIDQSLDGCTPSNIKYECSFRSANCSYPSQWQINTTVVDTYTSTPANHNTGCFAVDGGIRGTYERNFSWTRTHKEYIHYYKPDKTTIGSGGGSITIETHIADRDIDYIANSYTVTVGKNNTDDNKYIVIGKYPFIYIVNQASQDGTSLPISIPLPNITPAKIIETSTLFLASGNLSSWISAWFPEGYPHCWPWPHPDAPWGKVDKKETIKFFQDSSNEGVEFSTYTYKETTQCTWRFRNVDGMIYVSSSEPTVTTNETGKILGILNIVSTANPRNIFLNYTEGPATNKTYKMYSTLTSTVYTYEYKDNGFYAEMGNYGVC